MNNREPWNACRFKVGEQAGHYESWFQRANHPTRALAFWIRYTIFSPKGRPEDAVGELWAVYFDGEKNTSIAVKEVIALSECRFSDIGLDHRIGDALLKRDRLEGSAQGQGHQVQWKLKFTSPEPHLLFLPEKLYSGGFPKAKALVGSPQAVYSGVLEIDGQQLTIDDWVGSQNHNWGSKHTDKYAWGQVAGFDDAPDAFLEIATARVRLGPIWAPWMTLMVLRLGQEEWRLNSIPQSLRAKGKYDFFVWSFESKQRGIHIQGSIAASANAFVGLPYNNPVGGVKTCLNSKLASCHLKVKTRKGTQTLVSKHRAAFEILTDELGHKVDMLKA